MINIIKLYSIDGELFMKWITKELIKNFSLLGYLGFLIAGNILLYVFIYKKLASFYHLGNKFTR